jgi:hypothetical protein
MAKKIIIDKDEYLKYYNMGLSDVQISKLMNYKVSNSVLSKFRQMLGLPKYTTKGKTVDKKYEKIKLTNKLEQILIGSTLGDGNIELDLKCKARQARFRLGHCFKQQQYMEYKMSLFGTLWNGKTTIGKLGVSARSKSHPLITYYYHKFYDTGKKIVPKDLLYKLDSFGLAILYMDDGYYDKSTNAITIALCGFTREDQNLFQQFLLDKFGIESTLQVCNVIQTKIYIKSKSRSLFFKLVKPHIHKTMLYKLGK